ncbi:glycosyltransferase [Rossellomorea vietnamensis]|uniref:glycosyltransferase n=1 Tax=Rossellomorea vietnamensis TaxID=218284 RepID=UPI003CEDA7D6
MRLLHICSYYIGNKLYMNLFSRLSQLGLKQDVFVPVKDESHIGSNQLPAEYRDINYAYRNMIKKHDKYLYKNKITKQMKEIESSMKDTAGIDFIHAHTIFSDGGTAYKLHQKYGTPYIVNVRNTDINFFYKYAVHLRPFMYKILKNAKGIVFLSHAYKEKTFSLLPAEVSEDIKDKCHVIPNGIDDYWHSLNTPVKSKNPDKLDLLFVGLIDKNKNLSSVIRACAILADQGKDVTLHVAGSGPYEERNRELSKELKIQDRVKFHGYINEKTAIAGLMEKSDIFVMPSFRETFGLVYIEAMSKGLPVLYSEGQGIDGFFPDGEVGFSVDPETPGSIVNSIEKIVQDYKGISSRGIEQSKAFKWEEIAERYIGLYSDDGQ